MQFKLNLFIFSLIFSFFMFQAATFADTVENDYLKIEKNHKQLRSRLSTTYDGYVYTVKNIYEKPITIKYIDIWYNASGKVAYLSVKKTNKTAVRDIFDKGKKYGVRTIGLSYIPCLFVAPFAAISNDIGNTNAEKEAEDFDKKQVTNVTLKPTEKISIKTMAMRRHSPVFKLIFVNPITDENMDLLVK